MDLHRYYYAPHLGYKILCILLFPFSTLYGLLATCKRLLPRILYGKQGRDFGVPIISIGNLIAGGSGKTPFIIALCKHLCAFDYGHIVVISRGYKRASNGLVWVSRQGHILADVNMSGDEPYLIAKTLIEYNASVIVCKNRAKAIAQAKSQGADIVLLDDGFRFCFKKFDIILRPELEPFYPYFLPSGLYRESVSLYRTLQDSAYALIAQEGSDFTREVQILNPSPRMLLLTAIANPKRLIAFLPHNLQADYHTLHNKQEPISTIDSSPTSMRTKPLESNPHSLIAYKFFPDHYRFTCAEILALIQRHNPTSLLTTQKDATKLQDFSNILSIMDLTIHIHPRILCSLHAYLRNNNKPAHLSIADYLYTHSDTSISQGLQNLPTEPLQALRAIECRIFDSIVQAHHTTHISKAASKPICTSILLAWLWLPCDSISIQNGLLDEALAMLENAFCEGLVDFWLDGQLYTATIASTINASLSQSFSHTSTAWKYLYETLFSPLLMYCKGESSTFIDKDSIYTQSPKQAVVLSWDMPELFSLANLRIGLTKKGQQYYKQLTKKGGQWGDNATT